MSGAMDSKAAHGYLVDPLIAPEPSQETGPNSHFRSTFAKNQPAMDSVPRIVPGGLQSDNTPPQGRPLSAEYSNPNSPQNNTQRRSRGASLSERFPGDKSHRPLDMLKQDSKTANRSTHLRKHQLPGVDMIDNLDYVPGGSQYHHEGPFDATLKSRNMVQEFSPVAAVADSNNAALRATPREKVQEAVERHLPLDGVAEYPPGEKDKFGRVYSYEELNMMSDLGKVKKVSADEYNDNAKVDQHRYDINEGVDGRAGASGIEMEDHPHQKKHVTVQEEELDPDNHGSSSKRHSLGSLKRRIGSLRKTKD